MLLGHFLDTDMNNHHLTGRIATMADLLKDGMHLWHSWQIKAISL